MAQLVRGVEAAALAGLAGGQEDEGPPLPVQRERVQLGVLGGQRVDPGPAGLQEMQHVADRALTQPPVGPDHLRGGLRLMAGQARDVGVRQPEPRVDPVADQQRDPARAQRPVALAGGHLAQRPEAHRVLGDLLHVRRAEEGGGHVQCLGQLPERVRGRFLVAVLVQGDAACAQAGQPRQLGQGEAAPLARDHQPGRGQGRRWSARRHSRLTSTTMPRSPAESGEASTSARWTSPRGKTGRMIRSAQLVMRPSSIWSGSESSTWNPSSALRNSSSQVSRWSRAAGRPGRSPRSPG